MFTTSKKASSKNCSLTWSAVEVPKSQSFHPLAKSELSDLLTRAHRSPSEKSNRQKRIHLSLASSRQRKSLPGARPSRLILYTFARCGTVASTSPFFSNARPNTIGTSIPFQIFGSSTFPSISATNLRVPFRINPPDPVPIRKNQIALIAPRISRDFIQLLFALSTLSPGLKTDSFPSLRDTSPSPR